MKIKKDFIARNIGGEWMVVAVNRTGRSFNKMLVLNESAHLMWEALESGSDEEKLTELILSEYDVSRETALAGVRGVVAQLSGLGILE